MQTHKIVLCSLFALMASGALAQDAAPTDPAPADAAPMEQAPADPAPADAAPMEQAPAEPAEPAVDVPESVMEAQEPADLLGSWVIGANVLSTTGEAIGPIQDLLINQEDGTITGAVLSVGGFLGIGAKSIAVDWGELNIDYDANEVTIALTREQADAAPEYQFREREAPPPPPPPADPGLGGGVAPAPGG